MIDSPKGLTRKVVGTSGGVIRASSATRGVVGGFRRAMGVCRRKGSCCSTLGSIRGLIGSTRGIRGSVLLVKRVSSVCIGDFRGVLSSRGCAPSRLSTVTCNCARLLRRDSSILRRVGDIIGVGKLSVSSGRQVSIVSQACGTVEGCQSLIDCCAHGGVSISCLHTGGGGSASEMVTLCNSTSRHC